MALQKKNALLRAHLTVTAFWFLALFVITQGFDLKMLASRLSYSMVVVIAGLFCGVMLWVAFDMSRRNGILTKSGAHRLRGAKSTIGEIPVAPEPARGRAREDMLASRFSWWNDYKRSHPEHADAFLAVFAVMAAEPKLPASPVPGGHGGATLIEHSFNVVDTLLQMAPKWIYRGHKNKKGEISFPLLDTTKTEYRFNPSDPILPLTAFAHDIGKMSCYQLNEDGSVSEIRKNHDIEGAMLLRRIPEIMDLPWPDRVALLTACEFYHHIGSIPYSTWIDDRARALIELLIAADIVTGQREGGVVVNEYEDEVEMPQVAKDDDDEATQPEEVSPAGDRVQESSMTAAHGSPLDLTYSILLEPGRVNGTNAATRVAWKHGEWLYISDAKLRGAVADRTGDSDYNSLPHRGNMHAFTLELMAQLAAGGNLLQEHNGRKFSEKRAIFTTTSAVPGKTPVESRFVIVARTRAFPGLENGADCKTQPVIVECSWGETAAINKNLSEWESLGKTGEATWNDAKAATIDEARMLLEAAASMKLPHVEKTVDGVDYVFFEEEILKQEYPDAAFSGERFVRKTGGASGKSFIGVKKGD